MKKFKKIDFWINVILIVGALVLAATGKEFTFIYGYFIVGGWQVVSMLVHAVNKNWINNAKSARQVYNWITIISLASIPIGGYVILLFLAPFMAVFYTYLCYNETFIKLKRPLHDLR